MKTTKVRQLTSPRSGQPVANQFEIVTPKGTYFQSYRSIIAFKPNQGPIALDKVFWDYSVTTNKYLAQFLGFGKAQQREQIKSKNIILKDLNK